MMLSVKGFLPLTSIKWVSH